MVEWPKKTETSSDSAKSSYDLRFLNFFLPVLFVNLFRLLINKVVNKQQIALLRTYIFSLIFLKQTVLLAVILLVFF